MTLATRLRESLGAPVDAAGLVVVRVLVGLLVSASTLRFVANGWVTKFYVAPDFKFRYWGFEWVPIPGPEVLWVLHLALAVAALFVALGFLYRASAVTMFVLFTYLELLELATYLNHYYLVTLIAFLFCFLPLNTEWSLDVRFGFTERKCKVPGWCVWLLRFQVGVVYFFAGVAKLSPDWLIHAQPLGIWLAARTDVWLIGSLLQYPETAFLFSWAGMLNDLLAAPLLLWRRTRPYAFVAIVVFHLFTHLLFTIGIFPILMPILASVFFTTDWPRRLLRRNEVQTTQDEPRTTLSRFGLAALSGWCIVQLILPVRSFAYGGNVLWHEQGMRYSWRVMIREKNGSVVYRVRAAGWPQERHISPSTYLSSHQEREMSSQPDMILALGQHIGRELENAGEREVQVRVTARASLNGRPAEPLIDPVRDLMQVEDGLGRADWLTNAPTGPPLKVDR